MISSKLISERRKLFEDLAKQNQLDLFAANAPKPAPAPPSLARKSSAQAANSELFRSMQLKLELQIGQPPPFDPARLAAPGDASPSGNITARKKAQPSVPTVFVPPGHSSSEAKTSPRSGGDSSTPAIQPPPPRPKLSSEQAVRIVQRYVRAHLFMKRFREYITKAPELAQARVRNNIIRDIIKTEDTYIQGLTTLVNVFLTPLRTNKKKLLPEKDVKIIFSNAEQILSINKELFSALQEAMNSWPRSKIGEVFMRMAPYLKVYTTYINNFDLAANTVLNCEARISKFAAWSAKCQARPECRGLNLSSFLIMPVQRIPRYRLLLNDLIKSTPENHVEYESLNKALNLIQDTATFVNETKRQHEGKEILLLLKECLSDRYPGIIQPHRRFIREGTLLLTCAQRNIHAESYRSFLFSDVIVFLSHTDPLASHRPIHHTIFWAFARMLPANEKGSAVIESWQRGTRSTFVLSPNGPDENIDIWVTDIEQAIDSATKGTASKSATDLETLKTQRMDLGREFPSIKQAHAQLKSQMIDSHQNIKRLESNLREHEERLRMLEKLIQQVRAEKSNAEAQVLELQKEEAKILPKLQDKEREVMEIDSLFMNILNRDADAFREVFGERPNIVEGVKLTAPATEPSPSLSTIAAAVVAASTATINNGTIGTTAAAPPPPPSRKPNHVPQVPVYAPPPPPAPPVPPPRKPRAPA